jgi:hypothetical protein
MFDTVGHGDVLLADAAYDSNALHETLAARGPTSSPCPTG